MRVKYQSQSIAAYWDNKKMQPLVAEISDLGREFLQPG